jgi:iron complex outermembrane receptor protein
LPAAVHAQTAPAPLATTATPADAAPSAETEQIIVTGTRQLGRTKQDSPAPVDVISAAELERTGQQNVFDALNTLLPSLDLPPFGFDTAGLVRAARLRGLSPDDTLVLVDGKRRHVSANINADIGPNGGSDPVDLDMIPISLIDHVEVLRDGAAAQYGSDAIAGVINIILKHSTSGGSAFAQEGATYVQDGFTNNIGGNFALPILNDGFFDFAADYRYHDHTNRDGTFTPQQGPVASQAAAGPIPVPSNESQIEGDPRYNLVNVGFNAGYTFDPAVQLYSFGTYSYRHAESFENFRDPNYAGAYSTDQFQEPNGDNPPFSNLTAAKYYPYGFTPLEALNEDDYSITGGVKGEVFGDWHYDLSSTYGGDIDNLSTLNSVNPDFLEQFGYSPTKFHAGEFNDTEWTNNFDISKPIDVPIFAAPLSVAFGAEYRKDTYQIEPGDGPSQYLGGSQAYPGFTNASAGSYERSNEAVYGDLATYILPKWQIDLAGRFEHYSDVGDTETGKVTTRYDFSKLLGIRGTVSNGFRAPTLAQEGFAAVNVAPTNATAQFPVDSASARLLGSTPLKAERSQNYEVGFVSEPIERMHVALDFYQIDIRDQIVDSGLIGGIPSEYPLIRQALIDDGFTAPSGALVENTFAQFYTNGVNTRTRGADLTIDYVTFLTDTSKISWLLAANFNSVSITRTISNPPFTPDVLSEIKEATPKSKVVFQAIYTNGPWSVTAREKRFGQVAEILADGYTGGSPYTFNRSAPRFITDLEIGYKITPNIKLTLGADNLFDTYASHTTAQARYQNAEEYIITSPYGIDGGTYYGRINYDFGAPPPPPPPPPPAEMTPPTAPSIPVRTYLVFFDWDRADLTERARQIVEAAATASTHVQTTKIEVNGYTDLSGTVAYNNKLSIRRAETVENELVRDGVPKNEIFIHGFGESNPLVQTAPGVREPQNRRVEIVLK